MTEPKKRGRPRKSPAPVEEPVQETDTVEIEEYEEESSGGFLSNEEDMARKQLLEGIDEESKLQNRTMDRVLERRNTVGGRVPWTGQDYQKYNECAAKCLDLFGAESEVEILRERPSQHHVALLPVHRMPKWSDVCSYIKETQWDGNAQKYKITIYTTGRRTGAVCHLPLSEDAGRRAEWRKIQEAQPAWAQSNQVQLPWPQSQASVPQPQPQPPWAQPASQPQPQPQPPWAALQPAPAQPPWAALQPAPAQPPWGQPQPPWGQPPWHPPWLQPQPPQPQEEDDAEDDSEEDDVRPFQQQQQQQFIDPRVQQLEMTIENLSRQLKKLQKNNQAKIASAGDQSSMQQQWFQWQMLNGLHTSLQSMQQKLDEAKRAQSDTLPIQQMNMEDIVRMVEERVRNQTSAPSQDPLSEIKRTVNQMSEVRRLMEEITPQQPKPAEPPQWAQAALAKQDDGNPLKVFEMGPFRYVTDKDGKAVDFFTMAALNLDNLGTWIEPALNTLREFKEQIKDNRQREEMQDTFRMFEQMHSQVMQNQALQAQQIDQLSRRLAPAQSTLEAMRDGNVATVAGPPPTSTVASPPTPVPPRSINVLRQPGPVPSPSLPSRQRSLLDGIANAQRALQKKQQQ